jgi:hypothetical protein
MTPDMMPMSFSPSRRLLFTCALMIFLLASWLLYQPAFALQTEQRSYLIRRGSERYFCQWERKQGDQVTVITRQKSEECTSVFDPQNESLLLLVKDINTKIEARRTGDTLFVAGTLNGRKVDRQYTLDGAPWYQVISYSLHDFVLGDRKEMEFWMLHPETFVPYKMRAVKEGIETISVCGRKVEVQKVRLRIKGALSLFWHGDSWYRTGDGLLVLYKSLNGPPGSSQTMIEYVGP